MLEMSGTRGRSASTGTVDCGISAGFIVSVVGVAGDGAGSAWTDTSGSGGVGAGGVSGDLGRQAENAIASAITPTAEPIPLKVEAMCMVGLPQSMVTVRL